MASSPLQNVPLPAGQPHAQEKSAAPDRMTTTEHQTRQESNLLDPEITRFAAQGAIHIDEQTNKRLKKLIDKHVLVVLIVTYFLQSSDKNALPLSAIMGIRSDAHLVGQEVSSTHTLITEPRASYASLVIES
jgi:hypothetical protein